jgi:hypothetical protein
VKQTVDTTSADYIDTGITRDQREHGGHGRATELPQAIPRGRSNPEDTKKDRKKIAEKRFYPQQLACNAAVETQASSPTKNISQEPKEKKT